jgi:hypothetical protein
VDLGSLVMEDFQGDVDLSVASGTVRASGLVKGQSRVTCDLGKIVLVLDPQSDIRVAAHSTLGTVSIKEDGRRGGKRGGVGADGDLVVGAGSSDLDVHVECGSVIVEVGR